MEINIQTKYNIGQNLYCLIGYSVKTFVISYVNVEYGVTEGHEPWLLIKYRIMEGNGDGVFDPVKKEFSEDQISESFYMSKNEILEIIKKQV